MGNRQCIGTDYRVGCALNLYYNAKHVRVVVTISIAAPALSMSGLVLATVPADVLMAVGGDPVCRHRHRR